MNGLLITYKDIVSEWIYDLISLQEKMEEMRKEGFVSCVKVQQFKNGLLIKENVYDHAIIWEKRK